MRYERAVLWGVLQAIVVGLVLSGCGPASPLAPLFEDDPNPPGDPTFQFQLPADGTKINDLTDITVSGSGLARVEIYVDGEHLDSVTTAPFEWTLDPRDLVLGFRDIEIVGIHSGGKEDSAQAYLLIERSVSVAEILQDIQDLPAKQWYEIPNTRMRAVGWPDDLAGMVDPSDYRGPLTEVMDNSNGGAYDTKRNRLVIWGGGGPKYEGNEL
ncbi:MAG: Ig-like domain-containing protein, partial [Planctomycetota bacterium]